MRKLGPLNAMSIKVGDVVSMYGLLTAVVSVGKTSLGYIIIETDKFGKGEYNPIHKIDIYA